MSKQHKSHFSLFRHAEDAQIAKCANRRLAMSRPLCKGVAKRLQLLLGVMEQRGTELGAGSGRMRQRALQALTHLVKMDAGALRGSQALDLVRKRYLTGAVYRHMRFLCTCFHSSSCMYTYTHTQTYTSMMFDTCDHMACSPRMPPPIQKTQQSTCYNILLLHNTTHHAVVIHIRMHFVTQMHPRW